jgi:Arc/MetJ family transcription regulator
MRTTVTIDDELWATAVEYSGITEKSALLKEALKVLVDGERRRRRRLILGLRPGEPEPSTGE